jgi:hypothetical protein
VLPSKAGIQRLKDNVVKITSVQNKHKSIGTLVLELGAVIRG